MKWHKVAVNVHACGDFRIERVAIGKYKLTNVNEGYWFTHPTFHSACEGAERLLAVSEMKLDWKEER